MARTLNKLDPRTVVSLSKPGRHSDGGGLYLVVDKPGADGEPGAKRWVFLFRWGGRLKEMGLGGFSSVPLKTARLKAADARADVDAGRNPIEARKAAREVPTFGKMADDVVAALAPQWRNPKHETAWTMTLTTHAAPLRSKPVNEVSTDDVLRVLRGLKDRPETASRLRGRIERVLDAAKAQGFIPSPWENPARWRGHLAHLLPKRAKLSRGHHPALPYSEIPAFMADLRAREAMAGLALEFLILTAARTGEVIGARWSEIDLQGKAWTIPKERMKAGKEHRVPLSAPAVALLERLAEAKTGDILFPGPGQARTLSTNALRALLIRMNKAEITAHGFRSSFRDWAGEASTFPRELAELALAHHVGDETERAYRRSDALEKRRKLMDAWAGYCEGRPGKVLPFGRRAIA